MRSVLKCVNQMKKCEHIDKRKPLLWCLLKIKWIQFQFSNLEKLCEKIEVNTYTTASYTVNRIASVL